MKIFVTPLKLLIPLLLLPLFSISHAAEAVPTAPIPNKLTCQGKMLNPINDICWSCMFPIKIGGKINLNMDNQEDNGSSPNNWFCSCTHPSRSGVTVSFWEPTHLVEVVRTPFCMVSLGGISLKNQKADTAETTGKADVSNKIQNLFGGSHKRG
ncbi:TraU family protein, partial [Neisseria gonorrhoeae]